MEINYGLAGLGMIAKNHLLGIRNMSLISAYIDFQVNLKALFTTHSDKNYKEAKLIGFERIVDSMEKLVQMPDIDLVDVCTPNYLHNEQVLLAAEYGKNIYCEKPLGMNSYETGKMLEAVQKKRIKNQVALVMRFSPAVAFAHAILKKRVLGKIYAFRGEFFHSSYLDPAKKMTWRLEKEKSGGGALVDLGIHLIDLLRFLIGEIESVSAFTNTVVKKRQTFEKKLEDVEVDDWVLLSMKIDSDVKGTIEASRVAVGNEGTRLSIYGDRGSLHLDFKNPYSLSIFDIDSRNIHIENGVLLEDEFYAEVSKLYPDPKLSQGSMVDLHLTSLLWFFKSILSGKILSGTPTFEEAHKAQVVADAAYKSALENSMFVNVKY
jgi:predicted dehydrogenase